MSEPPDLETLAPPAAYPTRSVQDSVTALAADPEFTETLGRMLARSRRRPWARRWMSLWTAAAAVLNTQKAHDQTSPLLPKPASAPPGAASRPLPSAGRRR